jgi:integrase
VSVTKLVNERWKVRWRGPDGRERTKTFDTKRDAAAWEAEQRRQVRADEWIDPTGLRVTVAEYRRDWERVQAWRPSSRSRMTSVLDVHVIPTFGDRPLGSIKPSEVRAWIAAMSSAGLMPATVEANFHVLRQMMRAAVLDGMLRRNPCDGARLPRKEHRLIVPLELAQVESLANAIRPDLTAAVWLTAGCGLRQGETLGVTVDRVLWLRRELVIDRQLLTPPAGAPAFAPTKTPASNRIVPVPDEVLTILGQHLEAFPPGPDGLVFHREGVAWRRSRLNDEWRRARRLSGVDARFHDLRHYCASALIAAGVSVKGVQEVLGHATAVETLEVYAHLWPTDRARAREAMSAALRNFADLARTSEASET